MTQASLPHPDVHRRLRAERAWVRFNLPELWEFRDLLVTLAGRDIKLRYKQTLLGGVWVIAQPLLAAGIFSFVFGVVAGMEAPGGVPTFMYSFAGMLIWNIFQRTLSSCSESLVVSSHLVQKVYFPRLILPLARSATGLVDFLIALAVFFAVTIFAWRLPGFSILLLPLSIALVLLLSLGVGLICAGLAVQYRDVRYVIPVATQFLLFASPIAYSVDKVKEEVEKPWDTLYMLNPLAAILETGQFALLGTGIVPWAWLGYSAAVALLVFLIGMTAFTRMERRFADVI